MSTAADAADAAYAGFTEGADPVPAGIERRNYGRSHGYKIDGRKVPGVTTITGNASKPALINWAGNTTADYAVDNWAALGKLPPSKRNAELRGARNKERDAAANRGTQVHRLGAALMDGREVTVPDELRGHVDSYTEFLDRVEPVAVAVELVVAHRALRYCGTLDLIADLPAVECDGRWIPAGRWLLDLKTSRSGIWPETALQVCGYARAEVFIDPDTGEERPMKWLQVQYTGAVHVRADGWDLRPLACTNAVWRYFQALTYITHAADETGEWVGSAISPPVNVDRTAAHP